MKPHPIRATAFLLLTSVWAFAHAQGLPAFVVEQIRRGAAELVLTESDTTVRLVGTPTLPLVEVELNAKSTARFLVDLGANVVTVRRDVFERGAGEVVVDRESKDIGRFASFVIGNAEFRNVVVGIYETLDVDGVIGYNLLKHASFTIDYPGQRLSLHRRELPEPDVANGVLAFTAPDRLPLVEATLGGASITLNLDSGAAEWMTIPPGLVSRVKWASPPAPGRRVYNEQTGATQVLEGRAAGKLVLGPLELEEPLIYVNADAEYSWLGSSAMQGAIWTFDPANSRLRIELPPPIPACGKPAASSSRAPS